MVHLVRNGLRGSIAIYCVLIVRQALAANKEPADKKRQFLFTPAPETAAFQGMPFFHHQPSIIPVGNDPILDSLIHNKMAETMSRDPWETVPRLPDHDILVGVPISGNAAPSMHMHATAGGATITGVQDIMIDSPGGTIVQTFFGKRVPETDDDAEDDDREYDIEDDDKGRDDDDDDDDRDDHRLNEIDDVRENHKMWHRSKLAPYIAAPYHHHRVSYARSAALMHRPVMATHSITMGKTISTVRRIISTTMKSTARPVSKARMARLLMPKSASAVRTGGAGLVSYRILQVSGRPAARGSLNRSLTFQRPLRIVYH